MTCSHVRNFICLSVRVTLPFFFYDNYTCSKVSMLAFQVSKNLFLCTVNKENLSKYIEPNSMLASGVSYTLCNHHDGKQHLNLSKKNLS